MHFPATLIVLSSVLLLSANANAQAMSVFGGSSKARECYLNATLSSTATFVGNGLLEPCDYALDYIELSPADRAATYTNRGVLHLALDKNAMAMKDFAAALQLSPDVAEIYVNRGNGFFLQTSYEKALADYSTAITLDITQLHVAHFNRGMAYEKLGDRVGAETEYRQALQLMPEWPLALSHLNKLLAKQQ